MSDGRVEGDNIICGLHDWDYRIDTGASEYNNKEVLQKFISWIKDEKLMIDKNQVIAFEELHPQPFNREEYHGQYMDTSPESTEPRTSYIKSLAQNGLSKYDHHGPTAAMGVDRNTLPNWESIQFLPAQLARKTPY